MIFNKLKIQYVILLFIAGFVTYIIINEKSVHAHAKEQVSEHGSIVANALWNLDNQSPMRYLEEACINHHYTQLTLKDDLGASFITINADTIKTLQGLLTPLLPKIKIQSNIMYHERRIGTLTVLWQNETIYIYINIFIISSLILLALNLYLKLIYTNTNLENIVFERTSELENANTDLAIHKEHLEELVEDRTKELFSTQQQAIENAHRAGMADIANGVLHNIGNILNSVNTSAHIISELTKDSFHSKFKNANQVLSENIETIQDFIVHDSRGKALIEYYLELGKIHEHNQTSMHNHVGRLQEKIKATIDVIASQQAYAGAASMSEQLDIREIVRDAFNMDIDSIENHAIEIVDEMNTTIASVDKTKLIHIVLNLINNAKEAMSTTPKSKRKITFKTNSNDSNTYLKVSDTGCGISEENLNNIFAHGFTTKQDGHGFGLHSCANYMTEMNGKLYVESQGENQGATFTLTFPTNSL